MTPETLLAELDRLNVTLTLAGDKLHVEAPAGVLTPELKDALLQHKPALVALLREREATTVVNNRGQEIPAVVNNVFCFTCFKTYGKQARHQPHHVAVSQDQPGWWELTCTRCGSKCYMRPPAT